MTGEKLKIREIVHVDIANDPIAAADYRETEDPTKWVFSWKLHALTYSLNKLLPFFAQIQIREDWSWSTYRAWLEEKGGPGYDMLQVSDLRVQVVWSSDENRELYSEIRTSTLYNVP